MWSLSPPAVYSATRARPSSSPISPTIVVSRVLVDERTQPLQEHEVLGLALVVHVPLVGVRVGGGHRRVAAVGCAARRVAAQFAVVEVEVDDVEPVAVDAEVEPEAHRIQHRVLHRRVVEVQVGLAGQEVVQVVLAAPRVPLPGGAAEDRQPVVRRRAVVARVGPDVPVGLRVVAARAALDEPNGCWSELCEYTWSTTTFRPSACARSTSARKSASVPNIGSTSR